MPGGIRVYVHGPVSAEVPNKKRGWRQLAVQQRIQWFVDLLAALVKAHPEMWFLWGDKRWTRMFQGDPRYSRSLAPGEPAASASQTPAGVA